MRARWTLASVLVVLAALAAPARAADVIVGTPSINPDPAEQFTIEISVDVGANVLSGYALQLLYDAAVVNVVSVAGGSTPAFSLPPVTDPGSFASGVTPIAGAQGNMISPTGLVSVATVTLEAVGLPGDSSDLDVTVMSLVDPFGNPLPANVFPSSVLIGFDPLLDPDMDGLTNEEELLAGTDFQDSDTDDDGLLDGFEVHGGLDPLDDGGVDPDQGAAGDPDGEGLTNLTEQAEGCNPTLADTDGDTLSDDFEVAGVTDCALADTDGDTLRDDFELNGGLDPLDDGGIDPNQGASGDPDGDNLTNDAEQAAETDPNSADSDADGLPDDFEVLGGLDPNDDGSVDPGQGPGGDPDEDGLDNAGELAAGSNPTNEDTDGDGLPDGYEVANSLDPLDDGGVDPDQGAAGDPDADGHSNQEESDLGSDPQDPRSRPVDLVLDLVTGFQPIFYPFALSPTQTGFELLIAISIDPGNDLNRVKEIDGIEAGQGPVQTSSIGLEGPAPTGDAFPVDPAEGVLGVVGRDSSLALVGAVDCATADLVAGVNLLGFRCLPPGYSAFQLLTDLGAPAEVGSLQRFDTATGLFETATYDGGVPAGTDFPIQIGEAYIVHMLVDRLGFDPLD